jgi:hypothetical protein
LKVVSGSVARWYTTFSMDNITPTVVRENLNEY